MCSPLFSIRLLPPRCRRQLHRRCVRCPVPVSPHPGSGISRESDDYQADTEQRRSIRLRADTHPAVLGRQARWILKPVPRLPEIPHSRPRSPRDSNTAACSTPTTADPRFHLASEIKHSLLRVQSVWRTLPPPRRGHLILILANMDARWVSFRSKATLMGLPRTW